MDLCRGEVSERRSLSSAAFTDLVWAHTRQDEGLEHLRVRTAPDRIDIVLFICAPQEESAEEIAWRICGRVVRLVPALQGWLAGAPYQAVQLI
ncbi:hypothetical protein [Sphaerisporangium aureirubrum]|uniref:Uncharacterized protein n=1 Tax=Sphaerisporangium aureirubrum TaxID=1544736 RepID=A0ABW1NMZ3_9ACTN